MFVQWVMHDLWSAPLQDYRMDRCTRGDRCKFSHGEDDSDEKKARLEKERRRREERAEREDRDRGSSTRPEALQKPKPT